MSEITTESLKVFDALVKYLNEDGWSPQRVDDKYVLRMSFKGANGSFTVYAQVAGEHDQCLFYAYSPLTVPEAQRAPMAEFISRANYGMRIGNFEMDYGDGELRYKAAFDFEGYEVVPKCFETSIYPAVRMMDRYLPGVMAVLSGQAPADAVAKVEN